MRMYDIIAKKRDGHVLTTEEIQYFIQHYTADEIPDYQASALMMAIFIQKMNMRETVDLTEAMMHSGDVIDLSKINGIKVDKHSTGGVGDTTTLVLAPLVASCDVPVAKMSGRGLGHTGGTIDKLESIEGFDVNLTPDEFIDNVNNHKIAVAGQTKNITPADKKLYALRDVTATINNISLIASSIMSKKLASGSNAIVLDVKVGSGAFIKDFDHAKELSQTMVDIGNDMDRNTVAIISDMDQPLGLAIGNALEVIEAINTLKGKGPKDLTTLCLTLGAHMLMLANRVDNIEDGRKLLQEKIASGEAFEKFKEFIQIQKGHVKAVEDVTLLPQAQTIVEVKSPNSGYIHAMDAEATGFAALILGAGRETKESQIDLSAGILLNKKVGDSVDAGETIATFYSSSQEKINKAKDKFLQAITINDQPVQPAKLIKAIVTKDGIQEL